MHAILEHLTLAFFGRVHLDQTDTADRFCQTSRHFGGDHTSLAKDRAQPLECDRHADAKDREKEHGRTGEPPVEIKQHHQRAKRTDESANQLNEPSADQIANAFRVVHHARNEHATLRTVEKTHRKANQVCLHIFTQLGNRLLRRDTHNLRQRIRCDRVDQRRAKSDQRNRPEQVVAPVRHHLIVKVFWRQRQHETRRSTHQHQRQAGADRFAVFPEECASFSPGALGIVLGFLWGRRGHIRKLSCSSDLVSVQAAISRVSRAKRISFPPWSRPLRAVPLARILHARTPTGMHIPDADLLAKVEVLADLEPDVNELMVAHEAKRILWFPSDILSAAPDTDPDEHVRQLRERAKGISLPGRVALALNLLTEEGLPHFHRLLAVYLGNESFWSRWTNLWTAEEDRHGAILHDYMHDSRILDNPVLERMQFEYLKAGFAPAWDRDPYRVFVYTSLQERATQVSHANTGKLASEYEPLIGEVLSNVAKEEARHYVFYRAIFEKCLARDPNRALESAALIMPSIDMPGINMPHFREMGDVIRRAGIYGPRDYLKIVEELIKFWAIDKLESLNEIGRKAQEKICAIPARLERVADMMETRSRAKTFSFAVAHAKEFAMD